MFDSTSKNIKDFQIKDFLQKNFVSVTGIEYLKKNNPGLFEMYSNKLSLMQSYLELPLTDKKLKKMALKDLEQYIKLIDLCHEYLKRHNVA